MEPSPSPAPPALKRARFSRPEKIIFFLGPLVFFGIILFFTVFRTYHIPSGAMEPTLQIGDYLVVRMWRFETPEPRRGDIAAFRSPEDPRLELMKRVVGLPGDTIQVFEKNLIVNGQTVEEPYVVHTDPNVIAERDNYGPYVVPEDHFFMMGDNRDNSYDSRLYGPVPRHHLRGGGAIWVYWSKDSSRIGSRLR